MADFKECASCAAKPGSPTLCASCLNNRRLIDRCGAERDEALRELAALRLIVTEKFAGADMHVKPEDAADVAKWAANPGAVRELLKHTPQEALFAESIECPACDALQDEAHGITPVGIGPDWPQRPCPIAAAWRALGDPRGAQDIERAHEEALREHRGRLPYTARYVQRPANWSPEFVDQSPEDDMQRAMAAIRREGQPWAPIAQAVNAVQRQINERIEAACERVLGHRLTVHDQGALVLRHDRSQGGLVHVTILRNDVEQVTISAAILGDAVDITERWHPIPFRLASESEQRDREMLTCPECLAARPCERHPSVLSPEEQLRLYGRVHCTCPPTQPGFPRPQGVHSAYCATRLASESQQAAQTRDFSSQARRDLAALQDHGWFPGQARGLELMQARVDSDARGMEAVEDEARQSHELGEWTDPRFDRGRGLSNAR